MQLSTGQPIQLFELEAYSGASLLSTSGASQSSTLKDNEGKFGAANAVDGDAGTFSHTNGDGNDSLIVDLATPSTVDSVLIKNRYCGGQDDPRDCLGRLSSATISLLDDNNAVIDSVVLGSTSGEVEITSTFSCPQAELSQAVAIEIQAGTAEPIHIFEVEATSDSSPVMFVSAEQSSTFKGKESKFGAAKAIDGDTGTFSHTSAGPDSYLKVNVESQVIQGVKIHNRWCGDPSDPSECLCRLSGATVSLINSRGNPIESTTLGDTCGHEIIELAFASVSNPTASPILSPSASPIFSPSSNPSVSPTSSPTAAPSASSQRCFSDEDELREAVDDCAEAPDSTACDEKKDVYGWPMNSCECTIGVM